MCITQPIFGEFTIPGDKSISHRALILASQTIGRTVIRNLATGQDVQHTMYALQSLGVQIHQSDDLYYISGVGVGGLSKPDDILNMGNSGTSARLFMGLISPYPFLTFITGDSSLRNRPMMHVTKALREMCVDFMQDSLPLAVLGSKDTVPIRYTLPVPSAQLKSAILLAALNTQGRSEIIEPKPFSRDHTEIMLRHLGAELTVSLDKDGSKHILLEGQTELFSIGEMEIPSDPSSAAFIIAAALIVPGSDVLIKNVCINPYRIGFYNLAEEMGGMISFENKKTLMGEEVADIRARYSTLHSINTASARAPSTIDEFPILSILAAYAKGKTRMHGLSQLRIKESDRINSTIKGLKLCGVDASANNDSITITSTGEVPGGCEIEAFRDHRIAMSFIICSLSSSQQITVDDISMIESSFPSFLSLINKLKNR